MNNKCSPCYAHVWYEKRRSVLEWESGKPIDRIVKPNRAIASVAETAAEIGSKAGW